MRPACCEERITTVWGNGLATRPDVSNGGQFGAPRPGGRTHAGADFIGYSELRAIEPGNVTFAGVLNSAAGVSVAIDLPNQIDGQIVTVVRMHIQPGSLRVMRGSQVVAGQPIGLMGESGNAQGKCDHVEVRFFRGGQLVKTVDPVTWIANRMGQPVPMPASIQQRVSKAFVNGRVAPSRQAPIRGSLAAGIAGTFNAFTRGEMVEGNDIWFRGHFTGLWFWSGAFTSTSTQGLIKV
ncbi:peptidoglycan DD-metalloendopeptidase family protein [Microbacterium sp.]|uniref:peptidoglycan DD-metalloendopeptidase family protein n=1 Tax=Microbacterium sp. TaxID=51671 RepID=UPI002BB08B73|nr:peptidoglycan DD-metalloendopeptidase family protein [Microbacterium sp.]HWL76790.1 peptidoglycan DD-metalloendopeptidase family protein [Microbacterium sp.]